MLGSCIPAALQIHPSAMWMSIADRKILGLSITEKIDGSPEPERHSEVIA